MENSNRIRHMRLNRRAIIIGVLGVAIITMNTFENESIIPQIVFAVIIYVGALWFRKQIK